MKIAGKLVKIATRRVDVTVGRDEDGAPVVMWLKAPRLGMFDRVNAEIPDPEPPSKGVQKDGRGNIIRDEATGKPKAIRDESDPAYRAAVAERGKLVLALSLAECLDEVEFEAQRADFKDDPAGFARAVLAELGKAGVDMAGLRLLDKGVSSLIDGVEAGEAKAARAALGVTDPK